MMMILEAQHACARKIHAASAGHEYSSQYPACRCCIYLKLSRDDDWQSLKNAASFEQNSSLMPTTLFNHAWFLLASASFSAYLMQHQDLLIRFYRWHHFHIELFWYSIMIRGALLPLASFPFFAALIQHHPREQNKRRFFVCLHGAGPICK